MSKILKFNLLDSESIYEYDNWNLLTYKNNHSTIENSEDTLSV